MAKRRTQIERLPKAPLAEVVFELRWNLYGSAGTPDFLKIDPGLIPLLESFTNQMKRHGYVTFRDMAPAPQMGAYGVARRYFKAPDRPFPIMQIGPGIFATNESSLYEWNTFKAQVVQGLRALFASYPKIAFFKWEPSLIELRYIDVFDKSLLGTTALFEFMERGTSMKLQKPPMLNDRNVFSGDAEGRIAITRDLKGWKKSRFSLDLASGTKGGSEDIVRLETKVQCEGAGVLALKTSAKFIKALDGWLEFAHGVTRPFFKEFVTPELMQKFK
jgi:uncharacterized protein (TIGR04255 family)